MGEEDRVGAAGAVAEDVAEPGLEVGGGRDRAVLDRPFEAVAVAEAADREGRRQPGEAGAARAAGDTSPAPGGGGSSTVVAVADRRMVVAVVVIVVMVRVAVPPP